MITDANIAVYRPIVETKLTGLITDNATYSKFVGTPNFSVIVDTVLGMIENESSGNPLAQGDYKDGEFHSFGLMQVQLPTANQYGFYTKESLLEPETNIEVGLTYFLHQLVRYNGDLRKAILAYNAGSYIVSKEDISESINESYYSKVLSYIGDVAEKKT
jgi:soluble lytic murein transglycosylase-like protein